MRLTSFQRMVDRLRFTTGLACVLLLRGAIDLCEACAATVTTPDTTCPDASSLLATADGTTFTVTSSGAQSVGSVISADCLPETGNRWIRVAFNDGATGFQDQRTLGGESLTLECQSDGTYQTTTFQEFTGTTEPVVVTTGSVSLAGSLICEDSQN